MLIDTQIKEYINHQSYLSKRQFVLLTDRPTDRLLFMHINIFRIYHGKFYIGPHIDPAVSFRLQPIWDRRLDMRFDKKYAVRCSLSHLSAKVHAIQRLYHTVHHWAQLWLVSWNDQTIHKVKIYIRSTKKHCISLIIHKNKINLY